MSEGGGEKKRHQLILMPSGRRGEVEEGTTLLDAAAGLGVELESICGGVQTCGKCVVAPEYGDFAKHGIKSRPSHLSPITEEERECAAQHNIDLKNRRVGCAARLRGDLLVDVPQESLARKQVVRKEAGEFELEVEPALRLVYVELTPAAMGGPSQADRLLAALEDQWDLRRVEIDPSVLPSLQRALREDPSDLTVTLWHEQAVLRVEPGYRESLYGLAVDIGSTTLAAYLCDLRTGQLLSTQSTMNPQVRHGEDLMSRVSYAMTEKGGTQRMHHAVIRALNQLAEEAADEAGIQPREIGEIVVVGNTVMHHLALNIDPTELGGAPFSLTVKDALDGRARDHGLDLLPAARLHVLPCIAGHVGADCAGVLLSQMDLLDDEITLIVDIGTNAEIVLARGERILAASSPTGPALEGAQIQHGQRAAPGAIERVRVDAESGRARYKVIGDDRWSDELQAGESLRPTGICGSGIVEVIGELYLAGWLGEGGYIANGAAESVPALRPDERTVELILAPAEETATEGDIVVTQNDVRAVQLAKAALYAGARLLMDQMGVERVDRVRLAGAFGSYLDPKYAMIIGLIPDCDLEKVTAIGNAAGDGARIALLNVEKRHQIQEAIGEIEYVETAMEPRFQEHFVAAMAIPHSQHPFPHLKGILPADADSGNSEGRQESRRRRRSRRRRTRKRHD